MMFPEPVCREVVVYYLFTVNSQLLILHTSAGYEAVLTTTHCRKKCLAKVKVPKTYMCIHKRWKEVWQHVLAVKQEEIPFLGSTISLVICFSAVYSSRHEIPLWSRTHIQSESPWLFPCSSLHQWVHLVCCVLHTASSVVWDYWCLSWPQETWVAPSGTLIAIQQIAIKIYFHWPDFPGQWKLISLHPVSLLECWLCNRVLSFS